MGTEEAGGGARHGHGSRAATVVVDGEALVAPEVPGFELGALIARGGTSEVWAGVDESTGHRVAVKVVGADLEALEVAARESSLSAAAASAHVVPVQACLALPDGRAAVVMPHLRGGALDALVRARGHLSPGEVVTVVAPLASALGRLHDLGVVHGDVSPGNVLLELYGRPVLADLGLGHVLGEVEHGVWGTDGYVAPEVLMGAPPGPAADVYALGALGWLCLSGQVPGPPGLRPTLAEVSRAGEGSEGVVAVLQGAVSPHVDERPTAHELAWQLFHAARAEPLHLVRGDDETSAVTYRLRAAAGRPPDTPRASRWPEPRRVALTSVTALMVGASVVVAGVVAPHLVAAPPSMEVVGSAPGAAGVRTTGSAGDARSATGAGSAVTGRQEEEPAPTQPVDVRLVPGAPRDRPLELVAALADARAAAWRDATAAHLLGADAPGSAAEARDRSAVTDLARAGLRYTGLRYAVRAAVIVEADASTARLRARIDTLAYEVTGPSGSTPRDASTAEEVVLSLVMTDVGWRISDVATVT